LILINESNLKSKQIFVLKNSPIKKEEYPNWNLKEDDIKGLLIKNKKPRADFQFVSSNYFSNVTSTLQESKTLKESQCLILLKFLFLISKREEDKWIMQSMSISKLYSEQSLVLIQIAKSGVLNCISYDSPFPSISKPNSEIQKEILLISRVLSLLPVKLKEKNNGWNQMIDQDLTCFQSIVNQHYKVFRNLIEVIFMESFLTKKMIVSLSNLFQFSSKLPFFQEGSMNNCLGLLSKKFLETKNEEMDSFKKNIQSNWPALETPLEDLMSGIDFWNQMVKVFKVLSSMSSEMESLYQDFLLSDSFLKNKLKFLK
jgi:hypothetical protein